MNWTCPKCGFTLPMRAEEFPVHCVCGYVGQAEEMTDGPHWINCPHRSPPTATINARTAGCGCSSSTAEVYQCDRFSEPVLKKSPPRCAEAVAAIVPGYTGRTCLGCSIRAGD